MGITITIPPRPEPVAEVPRCRICGNVFGEDGVPTCNFLHGREVVRIIGGPL